MPGDVDAALTFLTSQSTVNNRALGVVGGSCGVNQAVQASRRHPEIRTIVLLSGGTDADGEAHVKSSPAHSHSWGSERRGYKRRGGHHADRRTLDEPG